MGRTKTLAIAALVASAGSTQAQLLNVSSTSLQSQQTPAIACAIVASSGPLWRGMKTLMVFAEAAQGGSNPTLTVEYLGTPERGTNDNWTGNANINGQVMAPLSAATYAALLRAPAGPNDAALLLSAYPGTRVCAYSREVSGGSSLYAAQVAITDVTASYMGIVGSGVAKSEEVSQAPGNVMDAARAALPFNGR